MFWPNHINLRLSILLDNQQIDCQFGSLKQAIVLQYTPNDSSFRSSSTF